MEITEFGLKELYEVKIKSTYPIEVAGETIEAGEVIAYFDKIQIANFKEFKSHIQAKGGYLNETRVSWDDTKDLRIEFNQGIFSKTQYALMNNLKYLKPGEEHIELIGEREELQTNDNGVIVLKQIPHCDVYIYNYTTGEKIPYEAAEGKYWSYNGGKEITIYDDNREPWSYQRIIIDYCFSYSSTTSILQVGKEFANGFLWIEGKVRTKDDKTGKVKTGIIRIPKLKLMSDLSITVGKNASPVVGNFSAIAYPTGSQGNKEVMRLIFLEDEIDSDI